MRYVYLLLMVLGVRAAHGQAQGLLAADTLPHEAATEARRIVSHTDSTGLCAEIMSWGAAAGLVRVYYASGFLKEYAPYTDLGAGRLHGLVTTWFENGQLESRQPFLGGKREGKLELYYEGGQVKRITDYVAGAELLGQCFDAAGVAVPYFPYEQLPLYPGGQAQLAKEINKALRVPHAVQAQLGLWGCTVYVSFWVAKDGSVHQPQVAVPSRVPALDRMVLATMYKLTRRFTPARRDGLVVQSKYYLPIQFRGAAYVGEHLAN